MQFYQLCVRISECRYTIKLKKMETEPWKIAGHLFPDVSIMYLTRKPIKCNRCCIRVLRVKTCRFGSKWMEGIQAIPKSYSS